MLKRHKELMDKKLEELSKDPERLKKFQTKIKKCGLFDISPETDADLKKEIEENSHPLIRQSMA